MPKISVLMPIYKTNEKFLTESIESILNQTFKDFEFIILDDAPDDNRKYIVDRYNDPRIKYSINESNLGISASRNKLIDMSQGEYLAIFDHDDISHSSRLEKECQYLDAHPEVGVVSCARADYLDGTMLTDDHDIKVALTRKCVLTHSAAMIRKSVLLQNNIKYDAQYSPAEDYALWIDLIPHTKFHNIPEILFTYREHSNNTTKAQAEKMQKAAISLFAKMKHLHSDLYEEYMMNAQHKWSLHFLGIPLLKICRSQQKTNFYLFDKIKIATVKFTTELQHLKH